VAELVIRGGLEVLGLDALAELGVDAFVTTRQGGISAAPYDTLNLGLHVGDEGLCVLENRARLAAAARCQLDDLVFMDQVHGARVAIVGDEDRGRGARVVDHALSATDAVVTATVDLPLVVLVADCSPILLVDPEARVLGLAHAGWRGVAAGVAGATVAAMTRLGASATRMVGLVGPTISAARYEVGPEVLAALEARDPTLGAAVSDEGGSLHADLAEANRLSLLSAGLAASRVSVTAQRSDDAEFFSDRAQRPCGRFGLVARLLP
jgi:YfiH family protein